jgi:hypothetical protein
MVLYYRDVRDYHSLIYTYNIESVSRMASFNSTNSIILRYIFFKLVTSYSRVESREKVLRVARQVDEVKVQDMIAKRKSEYTYQEMIFDIIGAGYIVKKGDYIKIATK